MFNIHAALAYAGKYRPRTTSRYPESNPRASFFDTTITT
jgi:hypothetical protein